jgi:hypothetical protein
MRDDTEKPAARGKLRLGRFFWWVTLSWFAICALGSLGAILRSTLEPDLGGRVIVGLMFGFFFGTLFYFLFVFSLQVLLLGITACGSLSIRVIRNVVLFPAWLAMGIVVCHSASLQMLAGQRFWFPIITSRTWPEGANVVMVRHGMGFQDKRHLWVFEGKPEQFEAMLRRGGWESSDEFGPEWKRRGDICLPFLSDCYHGSPWAVAATYVWFSDDDEKPGPMGPGWLLVDSTRTHWCVWWDAI